MKEAVLLSAALICCFGRSLSAPGRTGREMLIGEVDIAMRNDGDDNDDNTSQDANTSPPFTKSCIVDNKTFAHSQMIPWHDRSSHCLCVAGQVYCWWQTEAGPLGAANVFALKASKSSPRDSHTKLESSYSAKFVKGLGDKSEASDKSALEASGEMQNDNVDDSDELTNLVDDNEYDEDESLKSRDIFKPHPRLTPTSNSTAPAMPMTPARSTEMPVTCLVMGRTYHQGELLPHSTGNCVECSCGEEGQVECSPRDCVGLRLQNTGDDDFELFDVDHEGRGIEGSF